MWLTKVKRPVWLSGDATASSQDGEEDSVQNIAHQRWARARYVTGRPMHMPITQFHTQSHLMSDLSLRPESPLSSPSTASVLLC